MSMTYADDPQRSSASDMPEVEETLREMCRPFGSIQHWTVESANDGLHRCFVQLDEPDKHSVVAETLGGQLSGNDLCLEIRVR
jgi:hypothetical protein